MSSTKKIVKEKGEAAMEGESRDEDMGVDGVKIVTRCSLEKLRNYMDRLKDYHRELMKKTIGCPILSYPRTCIDY